MTRNLPNLSWGKKKNKSQMIHPICVGFTSVLAGHRSQHLRRPGSFRGSGTQSNELIWRFVFPPSGIWCQFSESFGPNCGWNVDHHSPHLSGRVSLLPYSLFSLPCFSYSKSNSLIPAFSCLKPCTIISSTCRK